MYSVRKTTKKHGSINIHILAVNLLITSFLIYKFGINYLTIFCSSSILHLIIETGLAASGMRKGEVFLYGYRLSKPAELLLRSMVEGPAFCVPAFFVADQYMTGQLTVGITLAIIVVGLASFYMGYSDRRDIRSLNSKEAPLISRREMTRPLAVIFLALINTICLIAIFLIPQPKIAHAVVYILSYSLLVMLFYLINYQLGVRLIERYDHENKTYYKPGTFYQIAGLTYDSAYEMALLVSPAYWVTFYLGLFHF